MHRDFPSTSKYSIYRQIHGYIGGSIRRRTRVYNGLWRQHCSLSGFFAACEDFGHMSF
ncbi:MAG: hypothetical protein ACRD11_09155 [Terriglobia bacterium]